MTNKETPWSKISDGASLNVLRATKPPSVPYYWGKDHEGSCFLIAELAGDHKEYFFKNRITFSGVETSLDQLSNGQRLSIRLTKDIDLDIFEVLCKDLLKNIESVEDSRVALAITLNHLKRWKSFMSGSSRNVLSSQEIRGLFAELTYLLDLLGQEISQTSVLEAWLGPLDSHQDFIFMDTAVEIKAISGKERNSIWISSLDQLQSTVGRLFLKIYRLGKTTEQTQGLSLNELVSMVEEKIKSSSVLTQFLDRLAATGYIPLDHYDTPNFIVLSETTYLVGDEFPKLTKSQMPVGIEKAKYELDLSAIETFVCDNLISMES